jgi:Uma2 family endonuclease
MTACRSRRGTLPNAELPELTRAEQIMSMAAMQRRRWTEVEVRGLIAQAPHPAPRLELVDGELLVTPAPGGLHQRLVLELAVILRAFVRGYGVGELRLSPGDVRLSAELVVQPDLFVIPLDNGRRPSASAPVTHLLLAIEVLSPDSARFDRVLKRRAYQAAGVPEYWIVDPDAQTIERWRPTDDRAEMLDQMLTWRPNDRLELRLDVAALFGDVTDD